MFADPWAISVCNGALDFLLNGHYGDSDHRCFFEGEDTHNNDVTLLVTM